MPKIRFYTFIFFVVTLTLNSLLNCNFATANSKKVYTLDDLISMGLERNFSLSVFKTNLERSQGATISAKAYPNPELEFQLGRGKSLEEGGITKNEYSIGISQTLERSKKRFYRKKAAETEAKTIEMELEDLRLEIRSEIKKAFFRLLLNNKMIEIFTENLKIVDELLNVVETRTKVGEAPAFELVKAKVEKLTAEKELYKIENMVSISMVSLNTLLGVSLKGDFDIEGGFTIPEKRKYEIEPLLAYAMENHPLILRAKKEVESKDYSLEMEKASVRPDVTVNTSFDRETDKESYSIGFSIPLPIRYRQQGEITISLAEKKSAESKVRDVKAELSKSVIEEYQNYLIAMAQIDVFEKGLLKQSEEALKIAELSYKYGESSLLDYLDAQRVRRSTIVEYYQSLFELEVAIASLERVVGKSL